MGSKIKNKKSKRLRPESTDLYNTTDESSDEGPVPIETPVLKQRAISEFFKNIMESQNSQNLPVAVRIPNYLDAPNSLNDSRSDFKYVFVSKLLTTVFESQSNIRELIEEHVKTVGSSASSEVHYKLMLLFPIRKYHYPFNRLVMSPTIELKLKTLFIYKRIQNEYQYNEYTAFLQKNGLKDCSVDMRKLNPVHESALNFMKTLDEKKIVPSINLIENAILRDYWEDQEVQDIYYFDELSREEFFEITNFEVLVKSAFAKKNPSLNEEQLDHKVIDEYWWLKEKPRLRHTRYRQLTSLPWIKISWNTITKPWEKSISRNLHYFKNSTNIVELINRYKPDLTGDDLTEEIKRILKFYQQNPDKRRIGLFSELEMNPEVAKKKVICDLDLRHLIPTRRKLKDIRTKPCDRFKTPRSRSNSSVELSESNYSSATESNNTVVFMPSGPIALKDYERATNKRLVVRSYSPNSKNNITNPGKAAKEEPNVLNSSDSNSQASKTPSVEHPPITESSEQFKEKIKTKLLNLTNIKTVAHVLEMHSLGSEFPQMWKTQKAKKIDEYIEKVLVLDNVYKKLKYKDGYDENQLMRDIHLYQMAMKKEKREQEQEQAQIINEEPIPSTSGIQNVAAQQNAISGSSRYSAAEQLFAVSSSEDSPAPDKVDCTPLMTSQQIKAERMNFSSYDSEVQILSQQEPSIIEVSDSEDEENFEECNNANNDNGTPSDEDAFMKELERINEPNQDSERNSEPIDFIVNIEPPFSQSNANSQNTQGEESERLLNEILNRQYVVSRSPSKRHSNVAHIQSSDRSKAPPICLKSTVRLVEFHKHKNPQFQLLVHLNDRNMYELPVKNESIKNFLCISDIEWDTLMYLLKLEKVYKFTPTTWKEQKKPAKNVTSNVKDLLDQYFDTLPGLRPFYFHVLHDGTLSCFDPKNIKRDLIDMNRYVDSDTIAQIVKRRKVN